MFRLYDPDPWEAGHDPVDDALRAYRDRARDLLVELEQPAFRIRRTNRSIETAMWFCLALTFPLSPLLGPIGLVTFPLAVVTVPLAAVTYTGMQLTKTFDVASMVLNQGKIHKLEVLVDAIDLHRGIYTTKFGKRKDLDKKALLDALDTSEAAAEARVKLVLGKL